MKRKKRVDIERNYNAGTMSKAEYFQKIRSALRNAFRYWKPALIALEQASRPSQNANKRIKKEYQCAECKNWFKRADVQIDHIIPCGSLRDFSDLEGFIKRMTPEDPKSFQILCRNDHKQKSLKERNQ